ncbi:unnamed protein product [Bemisia tabaci]|uniref:RRM domain-containing protein n=1 Tax=Bemisia tabaci TaxID=7038 RepID=A0A9P0CBD7_BEMTA|nr:unnamed protein product [Bemisia tabaci]
MAGVKVETAPAQNGLKEGGTPGHNRPNRPNKFSPGGNQGQNRFNQQRKKDDQGHVQGQGRPQNAGQGRPQNAGQGRLQNAGQGRPPNAGQGRAQNSGPGGPNKGPRGKGGPYGENRFENDRFMEKLLSLSGPTVELPPQPEKEKKFMGNCRLYIGNVGPDFTDNDLIELFKPYGETAEPFYSKEKNFGFIRLDYRANAEKAKRELDGKMRKNRPMKVRFAPLGASIRVKNLSDQVSNELLELAFSVFGDIERAVVITDERGVSTNEGIIDFARKPGAMAALKRCQEGCFFLTSSLRPVLVEPFEVLDDVDGLPDKNLNRKSPNFYKAREVGPRFAKVGSFEFEYGSRWKQLHELQKEKIETLKREMKIEEEKLEAQMELAKYEHETEMLREQLRQRELDRDRQKLEWEMKERQVEEMRRQDEELTRRREEEMSLRMHHQEDELRRRQEENTLFMQAQQLNNILDQQEPAGRSLKGFDAPPDPIRDFDGFPGAAPVQVNTYFY